MARIKTMNSHDFLRPSVCRSDGARKRVFAARAGFTLIEVLVVVAIIALLIAILLPSLNGARRKAQEVQCATNLRTCGQGIAFYLEANNDVYCSPNWASLIHKYIQKYSKGRKVDNTAFGTMTVGAEFYLCPSDPIYHQSSSVYIPSVGRVTYALSYGVNDSLLFKVRSSSLAKLLQTDMTYGYIDIDWVVVAKPDGKDDIIHTGMRRSSTVNRPSDIVMLFDAGDDDMTHGIWDFDQERHNESNIQVHHKTGNNFLYTDYHVGYVKYATGAYQYNLPPWPWAWVPINGWQVNRQTNKFNPYDQDYSKF